MLLLLAQLPDLDVSQGESRTAIVLLLLSSIVNLIANGLTAYYSNKTKTQTENNTKEIELAKIAANSAKEIAEINASQARAAHKELSSQVSTVQATLNAGT